MARKSSTSAQKATPKKPRTTRKETPVAPAPKQKKPVFSAGTWITVILLIGLVGAMIYINRQKKITAAAITPTNLPANLFADETSNVSSIEIKPATGDAVKVTRDAKNIWALELPKKAEADQSMAEAGATQVKALQVTGDVTGKPEIFGLDKPVYLITIEFADGKTHNLEVGDRTPSGNGYYVRVDKDKMVIVSLSGIESLLNLVNFPPYLTTPTPTTLPPTETPVPPTATLAVPTIEVTVTSTP